MILLITYNTSDVIIGSEYVEYDDVPFIKTFETHAVCYDRPPNGYGCYINTNRLNMLYARSLKTYEDAMSCMKQLKRKNTIEKILKPHRLQ